jgi:hypothetical protein
MSHTHCLLFIYLFSLETAKRAHRRVSASGSATGVNTPPVNPSENLVDVGDRRIPRAEFDDAKRYFNLFYDALGSAHPHGGYALVYNDRTGMCSLLGHRSGPLFKFQFDSVTVKNHYCTFRLLNGDIQNYLEMARSQRGVDNYSERGMITPESTGHVTVSYRN